VVIPAHDEAPSIAKVVNELTDLESEGMPLVDEIIVCNNGSTDDTARLARDAGALVVNEFRLGYGYACRAALRALRYKLEIAPDYVIFVDGDGSVKSDEVFKLLEQLQSGYQLVVGSRENDKLESRALSPHQRFGNLVASRLIQVIWGERVTDLGPFRAMRYSSLLELDMQDKRFGWTVEMQVKAIQAGLRYAEVAVTTKRRIGVSKISGTVKGSIGAGVGIFGKIFTLYWQQAKFLKAVHRSRLISRYKQS